VNWLSKSIGLRYLRWYRFDAMQPASKKAGVVIGRPTPLQSLEALFLVPLISGGPDEPSTIQTQLRLRRWFVRVVVSRHTAPGEP
jgi:hypothetical protein